LCIQLAKATKNPNGNDSSSSKGTSPNDGDNNKRKEKEEKKNGRSGKPEKKDASSRDKEVIKRGSLRSDEGSKGDRGDKGKIDPKGVKTNKNQPLLLEAGSSSASKKSKIPVSTSMLFDNVNDDASTTRPGSSQSSSSSVDHLDKESAIEAIQRLLPTKYGKVLRNFVVKNGEYFTRSSGGRKVSKEVTANYLQHARQVIQHLNWLNALKKDTVIAEAKEVVITKSSKEIYTMYDMLSDARKTFMEGSNGAKTKLQSLSKLKDHNIADVVKTAIERGALTKKKVQELCKSGKLSTITEEEVVAPSKSKRSKTPIGNGVITCVNVDPDHDKTDYLVDRDGDLYCCLCGAFNDSYHEKTDAHLKRLNRFYGSDSHEDGDDGIRTYVKKLKTSIGKSVAKAESTPKSKEADLSKSSKVEEKSNKKSRNPVSPENQEFVLKTLNDLAGNTAVAKHSKSVRGDKGAPSSIKSSTTKGVSYKEKLMNVNIDSNKLSPKAQGGIMAALLSNDGSENERNNVFETCCLMAYKRSWYGLFNKQTERAGTPITKDQKKAWLPLRFHLADSDLAAFNFVTDRAGARAKLASIQNKTEDDVNVPVQKSNFTDFTSFLCEVMKCQAAFTDLDINNKRAIGEFSIQFPYFFKVYMSTTPIRIREEFDSLVKFSENIGLTIENYDDSDAVKAACESLKFSMSASSGGQITILLTLLESFLVIFKLAKRNANSTAQESTTDAAKATKGLDVESASSSSASSHTSSSNSPSSNDGSASDSSIGSPPGSPRISNSGDSDNEEPSKCGGKEEESKQDEEVKNSYAIVPFGEWSCNFDRTMLFICLILLFISIFYNLGFSPSAVIDSIKRSFGQF